MTAITTELSRCARMLVDAPDAQALYREIDASVQRLCGHRLFTLLVVVEGGAEVERIYSSNPAAYPLTGASPWAPRRGASM